MSYYSLLVYLDTIYYCQLYVDTENFHYQGLNNLYLCIYNFLTQGKFIA